MASEPHSRMLRPEELTNVHSRELKIDLENEHFEEVNVRLSSDDEEDAPKSQQPPVVQRNVKLQSREINIEEPAPTVNQAQKKENVQVKASPTEEKGSSPLLYVGVAAAAIVAGIIIIKLMKH